MWLRVKLLQLLFGRVQWVSPSEVATSVWKMGVSSQWVPENEVVLARALMKPSVELGSSAMAWVDQPSVLACVSGPVSADWVDVEHRMGLA